MSKIHRTSTARLTYALTAAVLAWLAGVPAAHAHISVIEGGTHEARHGDDGLKDSPCGMAGGMRGTKVYNYKPGATINVSIMETISHPGYFRIAFDSDGDNDFVIPSGTSGAQGNCAGDPKCGAGKEDFCNSPTVLLDNLDQHASAGFGTEKKYTWSVKLPDIECDNCTLQIIQVMNDLNFHIAPYPADDIYYHCIDIKLSNDAPDVNITPVTNNGMTCEQDPPVGGTGGSAGSAGSAGTAGSAGSTGSAGTGGMAGMTAGAAGMPMQPAAGGSASGAGGSAGAIGAPMAGGAPGMMMPNTGAPGAAGTTATPTTNDGESDGGGCSALPGRQRNPAGWSLLFAAAVMALAGRRRGDCTGTTSTRARR